LTQDWNEANERLRERLQTRDGNKLQVVRKGENITFEEWADLFLEKFSKPPVREPKTHVAILRAPNHLKKGFATCRLVDVTADETEHYLHDRLRQGVRFNSARKQRHDRYHRKRYATDRAAFYLSVQNKSEREANRG